MLDTYGLFTFLTLWNNQKYMAAIFGKIGLKVGVAVSKLDPPPPQKKKKTGPHNDNEKNRILD